MFEKYKLFENRLTREYYICCYYIKQYHTINKKEEYDITV